MENLMLNEIEILSFNRIALAHNLSVDDYSFELKNKGYGVYGTTPENGGILEVGFVEKNPIMISNSKTSFLAEEQSVFIIPPDTDFTVKTLESGIHRHTTVEFLICYKAASQETNPFKKLSFPYVFHAGRENEEIIELIRKITRKKLSKLSQTYFEECELFMRLMHLISDRVYLSSSGENVTPGNRLLCKQAKIYISANIQKHLFVSEIADSLGISKNYLTNIFSKSEGMTLVEYMNRLKLSQMIDLSIKYDYTLSEAGERVGLFDVNYISRIFKKYYNMTFSEYKRTHRIG